MGEIGLRHRNRYRVLQKQGHSISTVDWRHHVKIGTVLKENIPIDAASYSNAVHSDSLSIPVL